MRSLLNLLCRYSGDVWPRIGIYIDCAMAYGFIAQPGTIDPVPVRIIKTGTVISFKTACNIRPDRSLTELPLRLGVAVRGFDIIGHGVHKVLIKAWVCT
jgi:hypothetical protein